MVNLQGLVVRALGERAAGRVGADWSRFRAAVRRRLAEEGITGDELVTLGVALAVVVVVLLWG